MGLGLIGSIGILTDGDQNGLMVGAGPRLELRAPAHRWRIYLSTRASGMTRSEYGNIDLGGWFIFSDVAGIQYIAGDHATIGYAYQHCSNAFIYDNNPGINFHILEIGWQF